MRHECSESYGKSVLCEKYDKWIYGRCTKMKRVSQNLARYLFCARCEKRMGEIREAMGKLCDKMETVKDLCYLGDVLDANGEYKTAVTARARY